MCILLSITNTLAAPNSTLRRNTTSVATTIKEYASSSISSTPRATSISSTPLIATVNKIDMKSSLLHQLSQQSSASHSRLRKRHSKRQSNNFDGLDLDVNSPIHEWDNPCGGFFDPTAVTHQKPNRTATLKKLGEAVNYVFIDMFVNGPDYIDIHRFKLWSLYEARYKFLPKLKKKSKIALKRWYSNMQTYMATFAYLFRMQQKSLRSKTDTQVSTELKSLFKSSRFVLCELEIAINKTHPNHRVRNHLPQVSREKMNSRLKLITRQMAMQYPNVDREVNSVDLKFSKIYFKRFLKKMGKSINKFLERPRATRRPKIANKKFNEIEKKSGGRQPSRRIQPKQQRVRGQQRA